jgi:hypothetical protein
MLHGSLNTVFGWRIGVGAGLCGENGKGPNPRSLRNFLLQANCSEMLRLACCLATERGIEVVAPVHDALVIMAPLDRLEDDVARTRAAMAEASRIVLGGFEIRTDVKTVRFPDRYMDKRGALMWERVMALITQRQRARGVA